MGRVLFVLLMIAGVVVFAGLALVMFFGIPIGDGRVIASRGVWPIFSLLAAGVCGAGIFMKPREFRAALEPEKPKPAAWIEEMRAAKPNADSDRDGDSA